MDNNNTNNDENDKLYIKELERIIQSQYLNSSTYIHVIFRKQLRNHLHTAITETQRKQLFHQNLCEWQAYARGLEQELSAEGQAKEKIQQLKATHKQKEKEFAAKDAEYAARLQELQQKREELEAAMKKVEAASLQYEALSNALYKFASENLDAFLMWLLEHEIIESITLNVKAAVRSFLGIMSPKKIVEQMMNEQQDGLSEIISLLSLKFIEDKKAVPQLEIDAKKDLTPGPHGYAALFPPPTIGDPSVSTNAPTDDSGM
jgi:archaellum component FlaC